jgi:hypothetical protein
VATCPAGHSSAADDYCDVCGAQLEAEPDERCPDCNAARTGRFCESCGYDFVLGQRPEPEEYTRGWTPDPAASPPEAEWAVVVIADREYYNRVRPEGEVDPFPPYCPARRIPLVGERMLIGRRSRSRGIVPEIDLSEPPADPGVSHTHAVLLAKPDGTWTLVDPGSTNGTTVNGGDEPIPVNVEVALRDGDRVHIGVWTTITMRRQR